VPFSRKLVPNRVPNPVYRKQILTISPDPPRQCRMAFVTRGGLILLSESKRRRETATSTARRLARRVAVALSAALACGASPAFAQVMDIAPDGTVSLRQGSGASTWEVVSPASDATVDQDGLPVVPSYAFTDSAPMSAPPQFAAALKQAAAAANISPSLLSALVWQESRWNPQAISPKGAIGLAQLMPATARDLGVNPADPVANLNGGARYLRYLLDQFDGDVERALAAYNAGPGRVRSAGGIPAIAETRSYVASIVRRISAISTGGN
jgi:soluble lytic murein transglycosylase-like protein